MKIGAGRVLQSLKSESRRGKATGGKRWVFGLINLPTRETRSQTKGIRKTPRSTIREEKSDAGGRTKGVEGPVTSPRSTKQPLGVCVCVGEYWKRGKKTPAPSFRFPEKNEGKKTACKPEWSD